MDRRASLPIQQLQQVAQPAALAYDQHADQLLDRVNNALAERADLSRLIGGNDIQVMLDNHSNHRSFMSAVFQLGDVALLDSVLPWVYRSYTRRGFSPDYFPVALAAWQDALRACLPAEHAAPLLAVYAWMQAQHGTLVQLAADAPDQPPPAATTLRLVQLLLAGNDRGARALARATVADRDALTSFYLDVVQPALTHVGQLWEQGTISVAQEHLATCIVERIVMELYPDYVITEPSRSRILVTSVADELHQLGARLLADLLEQQGWDVDFLGANTPADAVVQLLQTRGHRLLALSVTMPFNLPRVRELAQRVREHPELKRTRLLAGGRALSLGGLRPADLSVDQLVTDARDGLTMLNEWGQ